MIDLKKEAEKIIPIEYYGTTWNRRREAIEALCKRVREEAVTTGYLKGFETRRENEETKTI